MIKYLLDGRSLQDGSAMRGIGTYLRGLLRGFEAEGRVDEVGLLLERGAVVPDAITRGGLAPHPFRLRPLNRHLRPLLDPFQIGQALRREPPALYHAIEYGQPILPKVPVVLTIHDLVPFIMPAEFPWMRRERLLAMRQFQRADAVIAVSDSTAADAQRIAGVDPGRITVIPEGVQPPVRFTTEQIADVSRALRLPEPFALAVGTFDPRKRIELLSDVVRRLRLHHDIGLVIAGFQGNFAATVDKAITTSGIGDATRVLGHVSDTELAVLYQAAECLLFTSSYEGFGLPPLEAMAAGTAVAVFDNSSLPGVVGEAGLVVRDGDAAAMAEAVSALLADQRELQRRAAMGRERAAGFGWDLAARRTLTVYASVLERR